jgi:hypothetical protein
VGFKKEKYTLEPVAKALEALLPAGTPVQFLPDCIGEPVRALRCAMCAVRCAMCDVRCALCDVRCGHGTPSPPPPPRDVIAKWQVME